jgi:hypothetical protein
LKLGGEETDLTNEIKCPEIILDGQGKVGEREETISNERENSTK